MGKSRRNRAKGQRADPIGKPVKPPSDPELAKIREKKILPVLKDLQNPDPKFRTTAARAITNIIQDTKCRKLLLREKVVHILLTETLTDTSLESRAAGWTILSILTAEEDPDFCVHLYRLDILTTIQHACTKIAETVISKTPVFRHVTKAEQSYVWSITESLLGILIALAEAQDEALDAIVRNEQIVRFLFTIVAIDTPTAPVRNGVLSCMLTLSEDNARFVDAIITDRTWTRCYWHLKKLKNATGYKEVLACGILHNIFSTVNWNDYTPSEEGDCDAILVPTLCRTIEHIARITNGRDPTNPSEIVQVALEVMASIGTSLQEVLEKGGGGKKEKEPLEEVNGDVAMDVDDEDADEDADDADDVEPLDADPDGEDDEMDQDEIEADMEMVIGAGDGNEELKGLDDLPTLKALIQKAIPLIVPIAKGTDPETEHYVPPIHGFEALNNIAWTVSLIDFTEGSNEAILRAWIPVAQMIWKETIVPVLTSDTSDVGLATIMTSLSWAIARTLHGESYLSGVEHTKFMSLFHASKSLDVDQDDPFNTLGVKCVGVLGQIAMSAPIPVNREIGIFLLTVVKSLPETPVADVVETLNQLFDIYGDENKEWDKEVFWKDNFLQHLEGVVPKVKEMIKTIDKRKSAELRTRAEEARLNLSRFIQYKQKHRPAADVDLVRR